MSFIRRADGTVVFDGGHVGSRGSLSSIADGTNINTSIAPKDQIWVKKALGTASMHDYKEEDFMDDDELESVTKVFGLYLKREVFARFDDKYFTPSDH